MNPFSNYLVPPNMDTVCVTQNQFTLISGISLQFSQLTTSTVTCSDPWNYYKGYGFDIITILLGIWIITEIIIKAVQNLGH